MREEEFRFLCEQRGLDDEQINAAVLAVGGFEAFLGCHGQTLESATVSSLKDYIARLIETSENSAQSLLTLARYSYLIGAYALYLYLAGVTSASRHTGRRCLASLWP